MLTIHIQDEALARRLQALAERENRSIEAVLQARFGTSEPADPQAADDSVRRVLTKLYAKARQHWETVGDVDKAALTDAELDEQFHVFDEYGIPRLKSEVESLDPPVGSLAHLAKIIDEHGGVNVGQPFDASPTSLF